MLRLLEALGDVALDPQQYCDNSVLTTMKVLESAGLLSPEGRRSPALARVSASTRDREPQTSYTCMTSSPKWLITLTAICPVSGDGKGRDSVE